MPITVRNVTVWHCADQESAGLVLVALKEWYTCLVKFATKTAFLERLCHINHIYSASRTSKLSSIERPDLRIVASNHW
jgi:hypothetical protein